MEKELSLYIHIPFCMSKCYYCDFISHENQNEGIIKNYIQALCKEILINAELLSERKIKTIYIGGGTPSFIDSKYIKMILDTIYMLTDKNNIEEITIEVNPCSLTLDKAKEYYLLGINRVSVGLQTIYDDILKIIGRRHTYKQFINTLKILNKVGFDNISCDIIYPLPNLSLKLFKNEIDEIVSIKNKYNLKHISIYNLEIHENTKLAFLLKEGYVKLCDEDEEYKMRNYINEKLNLSGFNKYEISNYSKPGYESKHNLVYWNQEEYLGLGLNSSSYINGTRYKNVSDINEYINNIANNKEISIVEEEQDKLLTMKEYVMLNLRKKEGININKFKRKFDTDIYKLFNSEFKELENLKLINCSKDSITLTSRGEEVANQVFERFI